MDKLCYLIGLDLGTTAVKAAVYDEKGKLVSSTSTERLLLTPSAGVCVQDADTWYTDACTVIKKAVSGLDKSRIKGISISSQGITTVAVDEHFDPLYYAISWMDVRPVNGWQKFLDTVGIEYMQNTTGFPVTAKIPKGIAKVMWLREEHPDIFNKTRYFLMPASFVTAKLTGNVYTDHTMASGSLVYSNLTNTYDSVLLDAAGINVNMLPAIVPAGTFAGTLTEIAATDLGLTTSCKVYVGGQDQKVAAYGIGADMSEVACSLGTSAACEFVVDDVPKLTSMYKVCPYIERGYVAEAVIKTACGAVRWLRDTVCCGLDYDQMDNEALASIPGANGVVFVPYLGGAPEGNGFGSFNNIGLHTTRADLIRAVYEGIAFELLRLIECAGVKVDCLRVYSGGSKSKLLCQTLADVLNVTVKAYAHSEISSYGAAKLASGALDGAFCDECLSSVNLYQPDFDTVLRQRYQQYLKFIGG